MLNLCFAFGTAPNKWIARFDEYTNHPQMNARVAGDPWQELENGEANVALLRLPDARIDTERAHIVRLYREELGIAFPKDHTLELVDAVEPVDITDEKVLLRPDGNTWDSQAVRDNLAVVAANVGMVIAPRPLLRACAGKQVVDRAFHDPQWLVPADDHSYPGRAVAYSASEIALVFFKDRDGEDIQDFIGITKGRKPNSSRHQAKAKPKTVRKKPTPKNQETKKRKANNPNRRRKKRR